MRSIDYLLLEHTRQLQHHSVLGLQGGAEKSETYSLGYASICKNRGFIFATSLMTIK